MPASAWGSSASWPGSAGLSTCARLFRSRGLCTGSIHDCPQCGFRCGAKEVCMTDTAVLEQEPVVEKKPEPAPKALARGGQGKRIRVIGVPLDLGQSRRGVDMGPSAVRV